MKRHSCNRMIWAIFAILLLVHSSPSHADSPIPVVETFQRALIEAMKAAENKSIRERYEQLEPEVKKAFHVHLMSQMATGPDHWQQANREQKIALIRAFSRMSIATLATLFDGYGGEVFVVEGTKPDQQRTVRVRTKLKKDDGSTVQIDYRAFRIKDRWYLIDIILDDSISEVKKKLDEYAPTLKKSGVSGLIKLLNDTADKLMSSE